jgi:hypothetical protein
MDTSNVDRIAGRRLFTDGLERDVYEDAAGRQYVFDDDGERVYGQWQWPTDEPHAVTVGGPPAHDPAQGGGPPRAN